MEILTTAVRRGWKLDALSDLDRAVCMYLCTVSRSAGETLMSSLNLVYPTTRKRLAWPISRISAVAGANPPQRHMMLPWIVLVLLAYQMAICGHPRVAGLMFLG